MEDDEDAQSLSRSPTQSVSGSASPESSPPPVPISVVAPSSTPRQANGRTAEPVTVAAPAPEHHAFHLALAVPIQQTRSSPAGGGGGGGGGRDDCWSEGATSTLIDAWGERYLELSRGNLKQKHWQEVADAVTSRDGYTKGPKTDVQCKNRIDTLKKKYKAEKSKISASGISSSSWPFFHRLDLLLGPSHKPTTPSETIPAGIRSSSRRPQPIPQRQRSGFRTVKKAGNLSPASVSASSADSSEGFPPPKASNGKKQHEQHHQEAEEVREEEEGGRTAELKELTRAILRFSEVYEKVESSKLRQSMEIEKQRMEFTRELELQRMEFLMKTQMELSQLKSHHHHHHHGSSRKRKMNDGGSSNHHQHNNTNNTSSNSNNSDNNC